MQSRHTAFAILRRLAWRDCAEGASTTSRWSNAAGRSCHRGFAQYNQKWSAQILPQYSVSKVRTSSTSSPVKTFQPAPPPVPFEKQAYQMTFTCKPCGTRSSHRVSKQGYHFGSVLITCPECKNRHIISDHLGIFTDKKITIEDLMREKGQLIKKGTLSEDGNLEFWEDGTSTNRVNHNEPENGNS